MIQQEVRYSASAPALVFEYDTVVRADTPTPESPIRWYWHQRLMTALVRNHRLAFYIALDQLATVLSRERI